MDFRILMFSTLISLFSLCAILFMSEDPNTSPVYLSVFAQNNDVYFPDYLLTNNSETTNNDSNQSSESKGLLPRDSSASEGSGCVISTLQNSNECFARYENSTYGIKINYPSTWNKVTPYSDEKYTTVFVQEFDKPDSSAYVIVGVDYFNFETTPSTYLSSTNSKLQNTTQGFHTNLFRFEFCSTGRYSRL